MKYKKPELPDEEELRRRINRWKNAMQARHDMLMAGLRRQIGPDGDIRQAYRKWYANYRRLHDEELVRSHERWLERHK